MGRDKSHGGCLKCKQRKIKCNEVKPVCGACSRLGFYCSYCGDGSGTVIRDRAGTLNTPLYEVQNLRHVIFRNEHEESVLSRGIALSNSLASPLSKTGVQDLNAMHYLAFRNHLVRISFLACYSQLQPSRALIEARFHYKALNEALQLLQLNLRSEVFDKCQLFTIQTAISILGFLDSMGPVQNDQVLKHWIGLAQALKFADRLQLEDWSGLPRGWYVWMLEGLLSHLSAVSIFVKDMEAVNDAWHTSEICLRLHRNVPEGQSRIIHSPILAGQYLVFSLIWQVNYLLRQSAHEHTSPEVLDEIEALTLSKRSTLRKELILPDRENDARDGFLYMTYQCCCEALNICVEYLRDTSPLQTDRIEELISNCLNIFLGLPVGFFNYFLVTWPAHILACAIHQDEHWHHFLQKFAHIKPYMDAGHSTRAQGLFDHIATRRGSRGNPEMSTGTSSCGHGRLLNNMTLLVQENGVLA